MKRYYSKNLSAARLKKCYDLAPPRIRQYLDAEISFLKEYLSETSTILELGCGYGRILDSIISLPKKVVGIDLSLDNLYYSKEILQHRNRMGLLQMDAGCTGFLNQSFDVVLCLQNGISAFAIQPELLFQEGFRLTKKGGYCIFSSYSEKIWEERLQWFELQSEAGLLGPIDRERTSFGTIVCEDGFQSSTFTQQDFRRVLEKRMYPYSLHEIDDSSIFCVIHRN